MPIPPPPLTNTFFSDSKFGLEFILKNEAMGLSGRINLRATVLGLPSRPMPDLEASCSVDFFFKKDKVYHIRYKLWWYNE